MDQARTTFLTTYLGRVKPGLLVLLAGVLSTAGVLTTVLTLIGDANSAVPVVLKVLNLPACYPTHADVYRGTQSDFKKEGDVWREYPPDAVTYDYEFTEIRRTRDEILLRNVTRRDGVADWGTLVVHLPVCGGKAILTEGRPERRTELEDVWQAPRQG
jgi:hypothetical protein